jgi:ubiquitin-protein ligase
MEIKQWECEKKFILEYCSDVDIELPSENLNNTVIDLSFYAVKPSMVRGRILPEKAPYRSASFLIEINVPIEYPFRAPKAVILDPIYHPNFIQNDEQCFKWVFNHETWSPSKRLGECIKSIVTMIDNPDLMYTVNVECAQEYRNNYDKFYDKALEYTLKYG